MSDECRVRALPLVAMLGLAWACHRPPAVQRVEYASMSTSVELTPPPCDPNAATATVERRLATAVDARSTIAMRFVVRVVSADSGPGIAASLVAVDATRRASPTQDIGVFLLDSLAPGRHSLHVRVVAFLPLNDSLTVRAGHADTLIARLARWCR